MTNENQSKSDERIRKLNERTAELQAESAQLDKEFKKQRKETERLMEELNKQIGGLGNKFGGYTEALARPSIRRILKKRFHADYMGPIKYKNRTDVEALEIDAWGLSRNGTGTAYLVEVKSKFRDEHIEQIWKLVERFRYYHSDYHDRAVYPILAVVDISDEDRRKVWNAGIHLLDINDYVFKFAKPPEDFEANGYHGAHGMQRSVPHLQMVVGGKHKKRNTG